MFKQARISKLDSNSFETVRIKLTAWYLVIIMAISLCFSAFIYQSVTIQLRNRFYQIENRFQAQNGPPRLGKKVPHMLLDDLIEAQKYLFFLLAYTNGVIFVFSGLAGYFLAGKTLKPIESSMEEQKRFTADASHELKTPLTALQTSIEVGLRDKKLSLRSAKKLLRENLHETKNLTDLANSLLTLTRTQSDSNGYHFEKVDLKEVVNESVKKITPLAKKKKINIKLHHTPRHSGAKRSGAIESLRVRSSRSSTPSRMTSREFVVNGDKISLQKLITILLDNAVKYTPKGGRVSVSLACRQAGVRGNNRNVITVVEDSGVGIAKEDLPHVFDRFYRADSSRSKTKVDGFGLGLSIAKRIVDVHGGKISVKSTVGKGSTFTVKLPV